MTVAIKADDNYGKVFEVRRGEASWTVVVDYQYVDKYHRLWRWYLQEEALAWRLSHAKVGGWKPPDPRWPTWEQALEDALDTLVPIIPATMAADASGAPHSPSGHTGEEPTHGN